MAKKKTTEDAKAEEMQDQQEAEAKSQNGAPDTDEQEESPADEAPQAETPETDEEAEPSEEEEEAPAAVQPIDISVEAIDVEISYKAYPADTYRHDDLGISDETVLEMYRNMMLQRRFEERCRQMYQRQKISGFLHLYIGQEAISTGSIRAIRLGEDSVITAYRDHGLALAMDMSARACMAELFGKIDGCSRGKGGSMHFFSKEQRLFGGHGIVGAHVPLGAGIAFAHKYREEDNICLCFLGDGAVQQGAFHEALNLAGLYDLPVVMICENNQYGMGTSVERASAEPDLFKRATSYDMPGALVNGMDVFSVYKAIQEHAEMARESQPSFVEIRTYRYQGHSISDPAHYRAEGELDTYRGQDAIIRLQKYIVENDLSEKEELDAIDEEIKEEVLDAVEFAEESDFPPVESIYEDIYVQEDYPFLTD